MLDEDEVLVDVAKYIRLEILSSAQPKLDVYIHQW